jgi:hypothetical protein
MQAILVMNVKGKEKVLMKKINVKLVKAKKLLHRRNKWKLLLSKVFQMDMTTYFMAKQMRFQEQWLVIYILE